MLQNACTTLEGKILASRAMPQRLVAGLSSRRTGLNPGSVHVGFAVDKMALGQGFPRVHPFSPVSFIPPVLHYTEKRKKKTNNLKAAVRP
jgi:hypothetical protein